MRYYIIGMSTLVFLYLVNYAILRFSGIYSPYYSQGSWAIEVNPIFHGDGDSVSNIDLAFLIIYIPMRDLDAAAWNALIDSPGGA